MMPYMEAMAKMEENAKDVDEVQGLLKTWNTYIGDIAFLMFKSVRPDPYTLELTLSETKNIKLFPQGNKRSIRMNPGVTECVKGQIEDVKSGFNFGTMNFATS